MWSTSLSADGLISVCTHEDTLVHLSTPTSPASLCDQTVDLHSPTASFRLKGCGTCLKTATASGYRVALDRGHAWINLNRVHEKDLPDHD